jgi:hypothetical protein
VAGFIEFRSTKGLRKQALFFVLAHRRPAASPTRQFQKPRLKESIMKLFIALLLVLALGFAGGSLSHDGPTTQTTVTFKVTNKKKVGPQGTYMVYTNRGGFTDHNSHLFSKSDSPHLYKRLAIGHTYKCAVSGGHILFFSIYQNLLSCEKVKS